MGEGGGIMAQVKATQTFSSQQFRPSHTTARGAENYNGLA